MINFPVTYWKESWALQTTPSANRWLAIAHDGTRFCAVSDVFGGVMTSPTGRVWTDQTGSGNGHNAIVSPSANNFVAVGGTNRVMTSADGGVTWVNRTGVNAEPRGIAANGGLLVAVGSGLGTANNVMTSADGGVTWTIRTSFQADDLRAVCYSGTRWIAVGLGGSVQTSANGILWDVQNYVPSSRSLYAVRLFGSTLVAAADTGAMYTSVNHGVTWTERTVTPNNWRGVADNGSLLVAVGVTGTGNRVITSPTGSVWTAGSSAADVPWYAVANGGGNFVAVGDNTGNGFKSVMLSSDGF